MAAVIIMWGCFRCCLCLTCCAAIDMRQLRTSYLAGREQCLRAQDSGQPDLNQRSYLYFNGNARSM